MPSVAKAPNERWATDLCRVWAGRDGCLGKVPAPFLLRSDNGLAFTSRSYTALVKSYGLRQEFIAPCTPEQNGMVERVIRTLKDQCVHRHRFETLQNASRVICGWIGCYNHQWPHQAMGLLKPDSLQHMLREAVRTRRIAMLAEARKRLAAAGIEPLSLDTIQAEVDAYRKDARAVHTPSVPRDRN